MNGQSRIFRLYAPAYLYYWWAWCCGFNSKPPRRMTGHWRRYWLVECD